MITSAAWIGALVLAAAAALLPSSAAAANLPPAGTDVLNATGQVGVVSNLGSETFSVSGTATIVRQSPYLSAGVEAVDMELVALDLTGQSLIGDVAISESPSIASNGLLLGLAPPPNSFPASSELDVFIQAVAPANPDPTITLYNTAPLHMEPLSGSVNVWPPHNVTYIADTTPCVPLLPTLPMNVCITSLSVTLQLQSVGGVSELAAAEHTERAAKEAAAITPDEGLFIAVGAIAGGLCLTGATWCARRFLFR